MARIRCIKPEFCVSEQLAECSPSARLVFVLMWPFCDDQGIHPAKCKTLKAEIFPHDDITGAQVGEWVDELVNQRLLREYEVNGERYWIVTGWSKHQKIDKPTRKYPLPLSEDSPSPPRILADPSPPEGKGREGKGEEITKPPQAQASPGVNHTASLPTPAALAVEFPRTDDPRVIELHALCIAAQCNARALHAAQWICDGVTAPELREALRRAASKKPGTSTIPVNFLEPFIAEVRAGLGPATGPPRGKDAIPITIANLAAKDAANVSH